MMLIYTIAFTISTAFYYLGHNIIASGVMIALAIFLYVIEYIDTKRFVTIKSLFALGFIGGFGISLLKLSNLSSRYDMMTFIVVFSSYFSIYFGTYIASRKTISDIKKSSYIPKQDKRFSSHEILLFVLYAVTLLSFIAEAVVLGFIPLFTNSTPHAYSTFHVFGLHYITTLYIFIPQIAICNYFLTNVKKKALVRIFISYIYVIAMALLMVSRSQLIMSIVLSIFILLIFNKDNIVSFVKEKKNVKYICISILLFIAFVIFYVIITISRAHDVEYLNSIFDMKDKNTPIFITQPYMYIAHNFENLNYLITHVFRYTFGRRTLYPLFTLTMIKKFFPIVVDAPIYLIKEELSTKTLIYDFYYDFGLVGVIVFCFIIGYIGKLLEERVYKRLVDNNFKKNNYIVILFALYAYYMLFSFFQTYFSLTDTWVHIVFLIVISLFI